MKNAHRSRLDCMDVSSSRDRFLASGFKYCFDKIEVVLPDNELCRWFADLIDTDVFSSERCRDSGWVISPLEVRRDRLR